MMQPSEFAHLTPAQKTTLAAVRQLDDYLAQFGWDQLPQFLIVCSTFNSTGGLVGFVSYPDGFATMGDNAVDCARVLADAGLARAAAGKHLLPRSVTDSGLLHGVALSAEVDAELLPGGEGPSGVARLIYLVDRTGWLATSVRFRGDSTEDALDVRIPDPSGETPIAEGNDDEAIIKSLADFLLAVSTAHPEAEVDIHAVAKLGFTS